MGALESNTSLIYGIHIRESANDGSDFSNAAADYRVAFLGEDGYWHLKDSAGTVTTPIPFYGVRAYAGATTSINNTTWTSIALNSERFDTSSFHDNASNNSRLTVPTGLGGTYLIGGNGAFAASATGERGMRIWLNGTTRIHDEMRTAVADVALPTRLTAVTLYQLVATDYVELQLWQDSGGALNSQNDANSHCEFWMYKVG